MTAWSKQNYLKKEKIPTVNEIVSLAESISDDRNRCLFVLTYLTAGRIQEIVRYNRHDVKRQSIRWSDIVLKSVDDKPVVVINIRNEKHKTRFRKDIPVPLTVPCNEQLYLLIQDYMRDCGTDEIFPFGYKQAYSIITKVTKGWNPHFIRHIRLTHLVTTYKYREHQLMLYAGWSDPRPAKAYLEMRWEDLLY